jgi:hypothetical protein
VGDKARVGESLYVRSRRHVQAGSPQLARLSAQARADTAEIVAQDGRFKVKRDRALATLSAANIIAWLRQASVKERQQVKTWLDDNA